jgi:AcrR family transcriptional regulator
VPTGVAIRDPREQLFEAAERILLRDGPDALTTRAVTAEAGCANGVLHRHFADFDDFLAELVRDRIARIGVQAGELAGSAGTGTVAGHLADALTGLFESVALAIVALIIFRDGLRARLRLSTPAGVPLLTEATSMIAAYLDAERDLGRIAADADIDTLAPTLIGAAHLLFAGCEGTPPEPAAVRKMVITVIAGVLGQPAGGPSRSGHQTEWRYSSKDSLSRTDDIQADFLLLRQQQPGVLAAGLVIAGS